MLKLILLISLVEFSFCSSCSNHESSWCECEELVYRSRPHLSLKCSSISRFPSLDRTTFYRSIEIDSCKENFQFDPEDLDKIHLNVLRFRHCSLKLDGRTMENVKELEKFSLENVTLKLNEPRETFQDLFRSKSFVELRSLTLKNVDYPSEKRLNLEILVEQLNNLYRLEILNVALDDFRHHKSSNLAENLTYLSLTSTGQKSLVPLEKFPNLERILLRKVGQLFENERIFKSLESLSKLKYVLFEKNEIRRFFPIRSSSIDDLDLSSNLIERLEPFDLEHLPNLRHLTLTSNPIVSIDRRAFCSLEKFHRFTLTNKNRFLSPLDNCFFLDFPTLQIFDEGEKQIRCDCRLVEVFRSRNAFNSFVKTKKFCFDEKTQRNLDFYRFLQNSSCSNENFCESNFCLKTQRKSDASFLRSTFFIVFLCRIFSIE